MSAQDTFETTLLEISDKKKDPSSILTAERRDQIHKRLLALQAGSIKKKEQRDYRLLKTYQACTRKIGTQRQKYLINPSTGLEYVCVDDMFEIAQELHNVTNHGARDTMHEKAKSKYANVTKEICQLYSDVCDMCVQRRNERARTILGVAKSQPSDVLDARGRLYVGDMVSDGEFTSLMGYQDVRTKFIILRALRSSELSEIVNNLLDVFSCFGCPIILETNLDSGFSSSLCDEIQNNWNDCVVLTAKECEDNSTLMQSFEEIRTLLDTWMTDSNSTAWSTRLSFVQYEKNTLNDGILDTPFLRLFHNSRANLGLQANLTEEEMMGLSTENDVEALLFSKTDLLADHARVRFDRTLLQINEKKDYSSSLLTKTKFEGIVQRLKDLQANRLKKEVRDYRLLKTYELMETSDGGNTVEILQKPGTNIKYLCHDEMYEVIRSIHSQTYHGARDTMHEIGKRTYVNLTKEVLQIFIDQCDECRGRKKNKARFSLGLDNVPSTHAASKITDYRGHVEIMEANDDGSEFILKYQDVISKFVILRSMQSGNVDEVAGHLLNIFHLFGTPVVLQSSQGLNFRLNIVNKIHAMAKTSLLVHGETHCEAALKATSEVIRDRLAEWSASNETQHWRCGLRVVQWEVNNELAPYSTMFRHPPVLGVKSLNLTAGQVLGLRSEDDLEQLMSSVDVQMKSGEPPVKKSRNDKEQDNTDHEGEVKRKRKGKPRKSR